jgi:hypothetical protein
VAEQSQGHKGLRGREPLDHETLVQNEQHNPDSSNDQRGDDPGIRPGVDSSTGQEAVQQCLESQADQNHTTPVYLFGVTRDSTLSWPVLEEGGENYDRRNDQDWIDPKHPVS